MFGSADDIAPGVDFFRRLNDAGNFLPVDPTPAKVESGQTPVVIDWDYLNAAESKEIPTWKVFVPNDALVGGYYFQAINKDGPHPAAARLWQEFLYSDEVQNLWLAGGAGVWFGLVAWLLIFPVFSDPAGLVEGRFYSGEWLRFHTSAIDKGIEDQIRRDKREILLYRNRFKSDAGM